MRLKWTQWAKQDKEGIIDYIARENFLAAIHQGDEIENQIEMLLQHPNLGRTGRVKGSRELVITDTPYIVAYRIKGEAVHILRILHGAQNWPCKL